MARSFHVPKHATYNLFLNHDHDKDQHVKTDDGTFTGQFGILIGYCPDTLECFQAMYEAAKKSFPALTPGDVTCGRVTQSSYNKGFTLILFQATPFLKGWKFVDADTPFIGADGKEWDIRPRGIDFSY